jgi:hypothetical protein
MLKRSKLAAIAFAFVMAYAAVASAVSYPLSGSWKSQRGSQVIPIVGAVPFPSGATINATGMGFRSVAGTGMLTLPASAINRAPVPLAFPIPNPTLVQLATDFLFKAPGTAMAGPAVLSAGGGLAGRLAPSFSFCPGASANPGCTDHRSTGQGAAAGQGTQHGIVKYTAGQHTWGGTMASFLMAGPLSAVTRLSGGTGLGPLTVQHDAIGTGMGTTGQVGRSYGFINTNVLPGGPIFVNAWITGGGLINQASCAPNCASVPGQGTAMGVGSSRTVMNTGFPFSTGTVYVKATDSPPAPTTFTEVGSNMLSPSGRGNITLVAGGLGHRSAGVTFAQFDIVKISTPLTTPSLSRAGYVAGAALMALTIGFVMRRRL